MRVPKNFARGIMGKSLRLVSFAVRKEFWKFWIIEWFLRIGTVSNWRRGHNRQFCLKNLVEKLIGLIYVRLLAHSSRCDYVGDSTRWWVQISASEIRSERVADQPSAQTHVRQHVQCRLCQLMSHQVCSNNFLLFHYCWNIGTKGARYLGLRKLPGQNRRNLVFFRRIKKTKSSSYCSMPKIVLKVLQRPTQICQSETALMNSGAFSLH